MKLATFLGLAACASVVVGCSDPAPTPPVDASPGDVAVGDAADVQDTGPVQEDVPMGPVRSVFDPSADITTAARFYDMPYPSDLRLTAEGRPDLRGFPVRGTLVPPVVEIAKERPGWPVIPAAYFRFTGPLSMRSAEAVIAAEPTSPILLLDIDARSPERGQLVPVVAATPAGDPYLPANSLAVGPRPGFVLRAGRTYAVVVRRSLNDATGAMVEPSETFRALRDGSLPTSTPNAARLTALYAPLWETLTMRSISRDDVVAATVFTTGDIVADTAALGQRVVDRFDVTLANLALAPGDSSTTHPRFCHLQGRMQMPQFQRGAPPFNTEGTFAFDAQGVPVPVTYTTPANYASVPFSLTLPRREMPAEGFPLVMYFHGSGGLSTQAVDRGTWRPRSTANPCPQGVDEWEGVPGCNTLGEGPAHILAARGLATAAPALPVNPERLPGASGIAYLNLTNLAAFRDTFRQGVLEQRLFLEALERLRIPASLVAQCTGASLPTGTTEGRFDTRRLVAMGQSMGGMYTNMISATEPKVRASIPTGAGGFWGYFILQTQLVPGAAVALRPLIGTTIPLTHLHPALAMLETAWEAAEPRAYTPRLARDPLPDHPVRPIYEPAGEGDSYFPTQVYDAMALAYRHPQVGATVWPTMQTALGLAGLQGVRAYPLENNLQSLRESTPYTGAIVQYRGDGVYDPHAIYSQLDAVKYQYACFAETFVQTGRARIVDPAGRNPTSPCM